MRDVAERAGVGTITVSRALRNPDSVSPALRKRIYEAMRELNYIPNSIAGILSSSRSNAVVIIVPSIAESTFADTIQGITDVLDKHGMHILLGTSRYSLDIEEDLLRLMLSWRPAGAFITGTEHSPATSEMFRRMGTPVVEFWDISDKPIDMSVGFSHFQIGEEITHHLVEQGARRIAFVRGNYESGDRAGTREKGYRKALQDRGIDFALTLAPAQGPIGIAGGAEAMRRILRDHPEVDAVVFGSDYPAAGALFECQRQGISVPGQIKLAGIGDYDIASQLYPSLTTVQMPRYEVGKRAANLMMERISGADVTGSVVVLDTPLIVRESTGAGSLAPVIPAG
ncbi:LacI family DNA-binding transcriptional regulator [Nitratireductor indicus]|uniref:Transcriptional regulator, LacI family protein n=1 Tax=Nitratireductor indicus C115 TaxID=1231190 RepID=K2N5A6_9HYPH|nr:LacI family DNA-binding transcriptional regulator [Nitratireductor indicus]EKF42583.1 transcriptional regulator, LacI family protein [Nitratireductor indicus C115]MDS1138072.1 LacI family DNA-binding transcriptional regulator [Nitratireductor indicus]SFQ57585.1 LacI family transcriptional regulator, gluconate utilization system Gnt-I transcriptional repressor [Nitratireductor indicus]